MNREAPLPTSRKTNLSKRIALCYCTIYLVVLSTFSSLSMVVHAFAYSHTHTNRITRKPVSTYNSGTEMCVASMASDSESSDSFLMNKRNSVVSSAFEALGEKDQYDAVLTGLCAKILDGKYQPSPTSTTEDAAEEGEGEIYAKKVNTDAFETLRDPMRLMTEMNVRKIRASERSLMALVDATALTQDPRAMSTILSLSIRNGALSSYGSLQDTVLPFPTSPTSRYLRKEDALPQSDSRSKRRTPTTRAERIQNIPPVPSDERDVETVAAFGALFTVVTCLILQTGVGDDNLASAASLILTILTVVGVVDNFYDAISAVGSLAVKANAERLPDIVTETKKVEAKDMPFGLGSGAITGNVLRGFNRLVKVDTERECRCEAASFFTAYSIGLPCFSLRPNALEAAVLVFDSYADSTSIDKREGSLDNLLSSAGIMKLLVWLLAPVAMETAKYPQLISSEPREAKGLLRRLEEKAGLFGAEEALRDVLRLTKEDGGGEKEVEEMLQWAYAEADLLLRRNKETVDELAENLIGGASTIGDCVAVIEGW